MSRASTPDPEAFQLTLGEHLAELRARLIKSALALALAAGLCFGFSRRLLDAILRPAAEVFFYGPGEAFGAHLRVALLAAMPLAWPVWLYQAYAFLRPGLLAAERRFLRLFVPLGTALFGAGLAFGYAVILPLMLVWLRRFGGADVAPAISVGLYTEFLLSATVPFGLAFEWPLVVLALARLGLLDARALAAARPWAILGLLIVAALLTPPDVLSQLALGVPLILLYEAAALVARLTTARRRPRRRGAAA